MSEYILVTQFSQKYGIDSSSVRKYIAQGRIHATKTGNQWAIPVDIVPPYDKRFESGRYKK